MSVIVPVYNGETFLEKCINSILVQSYKDFELILVDDGSTDKSGQLCDEFAEKDYRVKVIHKKNEGLICARITGVKMATGKWIAFVDADDWVEKNFLGCLADCMNKADADIVVSGCFYEKESGTSPMVNQIETGIYEGEKLKTELIAKMLHYHGFYQFGILPYMWNKLFRRESLMDCYKNIDTKIYDGEDVATVYPYLLKTKRVVVIHDCLYHYRIHENSMTFKKKENFYENVSRLYLHLYNNFKESQYFDLMLPQLSQYMRMMVWVGMPVEMVEKERYFFPFSKIPCGSRVVLYGAGFVGKIYHWQIKRTGYCQLVLWVDRDFEELLKQGLDVHSPEWIRQMDYDYVVIANTKEKIQKEMERYLISQGTRKEQIVTGEDKPVKILV